MWPDDLEAGVPADDEPSAGEPATPPAEGTDLGAGGQGPMAEMAPDDAPGGGPAAQGGAEEEEDDPVAAQWAAMLAEQQARSVAQAVVAPSVSGAQTQAQPLQFPQLSQVPPPAGGGSLELLMDVRLPISVELGRAEMEIKDILEFGPGTVVELNKMAGDLVDIMVNGRLVAQGEVVVVDEHFGVRVTHLLSPQDRIRSLA